MGSGRLAIWGFGERGVWQYGGLGKYGSLGKRGFDLEDFVAGLELLALELPHLDVRLVQTYPASVPVSAHRSTNVPAC
eukprot:2029592-Rhodomonas_salina.1